MSDIEQKQFLSCIRDQIIKEHLNTNLETYIERQNKGIFAEITLAEILSEIKDESYDYVIEYILTCEDGLELLNVFSGSGRLLQELKARKILGRFSKIHCVDSSPAMIDFEKSRYKKDNIFFYCRDVLKWHDDIQYDVAICHCGLRYIPLEDYDCFVETMQKLKRNNRSRCLLSETKYSIIEKMIDVLNKKNIPFSLRNKSIYVQRNSVLYDLFSLYKDNVNFKSVINTLMVNQQKRCSTILIELAGYKKTDMFILTV